MAKAKKTSKKNSKVANKDSLTNAPILAATAILFAGVLVILMGNIQGLSSLKLLLVGFGAALLVVGGVMLSIAATSSK